MAIRINHIFLAINQATRRAIRMVRAGFRSEESLFEPEDLEEWFVVDTGLETRTGQRGMRNRPATPFPHEDTLNDESSVSSETVEDLLVENLNATLIVANALTPYALCVRMQAEVTSRRGSPVSSEASGA